LSGVAGLDVLGEHEHADPGVATAKVECGSKPLVGVGRRHPDVQDRDVGAALFCSGNDAVTVTCHGDDLVAMVRE